MSALISILDGNTFLVSDRRGDIDPNPTFPTGFFSYDTRFISTWQLTINGQRLTPISVDDLQYFEARFFGIPSEPARRRDATLSVIRHRTIGASFAENLTILNHASDTADLIVRMEIGSDFADIFEIKNPQRKRFLPRRIVGENQLQLAYQRGNFRRNSLITSSASAEVDEHGMTFRLRLPPHGQWSTELKVASTMPGVSGTDWRDAMNIRHARSKPELEENLAAWLANAPKLSCDSRALSISYKRSLVDLAALRYTSLSTSGQLVAAGLPWFMTLFGRDSILTCIQTLPFLPHLAPYTLGLLANGQAGRFDDFRDAEPGKILHELRYGESAAFEEQPHSSYFGAADSAPLFVILLDEYERWTGDSQMVRALEWETRAALDWIDTYADLLGTGYIWYQTRNPETGLTNQCWKDSPDAISYHDGRIPNYPIAVCEIQGYAYDAKIRAARLARHIWNDPDLANHLEHQAANLKERFNQDFWIPDKGHYALALDPHGQHIDALTSNNGHLLWSGIVPEHRAKNLVEHLLGPALFTGWGIRTLATTEARYNPLGYHVGTVWPFDNSITAWGLQRYGYRNEAGVIAQAIIEAAGYFKGRLPEAFAGYPRHQTKYPVEYPTACSPQAWSAGTPLLLLRVLLGLQPLENHLIIDPHIPPDIGRIELLDIPGRWGHTDAYGRPR